MSELETLIAVLLGRIDNPRKQEQLAEGVVPPYLLDEYNRMGAAADLYKSYPGNLSALGAIAYATVTDEAPKVRLQCAKLIADSGWQGREYVLLCCTYDRDADVRLLSLEAMAINQLACTQDAASRLVGDTDDLVYDLALRLLRGELSWPIYQY